MSWAKFDDECPGCRPALLNVETGQRLGDDDPAMQAINSVWAKTTLEERQAFHRVCCLNSRAIEDLVIMKSLGMRFEAAGKKADAG